MRKFLKRMGVVLALFAGVAFAADNSIYIDQSGSNSAIDITQTGTGNVVRGIQGVGTSNSTPARMTGDASNVDVQQIGADNTLNLGFNVTTAATMGYGIDLTYYVTGNNGSATFNINNDGTGTAASNLIDVRQTGNSAGINLTLTGSKNSFIATTTGGASNSITATVGADDTNTNIAVSGGGSNGITLNLTSNKGLVDIDVVGASNTLSLTQTGTAGATGHQFTYNVNGSSNSMTATQTGTADNIINVQSVGNGNTWNITQGQ